MENDSSVWATIMPKKHDIQGKQFGKWTVLGEAKRKYRNDILWNCQCECGRKFQVRGTYLVNGKSKRCNYCHKHSKKYYEANNVPIQLWKQIEKNARKRDIKFEITREEAYEQFEKQNGRCVLSGMELSFPTCASEWLQATASLDRRDNTRGYEKNNIQWLHKDINKMKNTYEEKYFIDLCRKVTENINI